MVTDGHTMLFDHCDEVGVTLSVDRLKNANGFDPLSSLNTLSLKDINSVHWRSAGLLYDESCCIVTAPRWTLPEISRLHLFVRRFCATIFTAWRYCVRLRRFLRTRVRRAQNIALQSTRWRKQSALAGCRLPYRGGKSRYGFSPLGARVALNRRMRTRVFNYK